MYSITTATKKLATLTKRIRAVPGGTSAGKTIGIDQILIDAAQRDIEPTITSIVSESLPHLKRGAMRDFLDIMDKHNYFNDGRWNKSDFTYNFETGSKIEFFSVDQPSKTRGPRRDRLFVNEANHVSFETFEQLELRTKQFIFLDWNPSEEFWYYTELKPKRDDVEELTLTYLDNEALDQNIRKSIEQRRNRVGWFKVYGLGQLGEVEGKIYSDWQIIEKIPHEARLVRYGLDFGYTNDPSVIVAIYAYNGGYIIDEILYQKGMSNADLKDTFLTQPKALIIADSAEPKSIDEIKSYKIGDSNIPIIATVKGKDSVKNGIQFVQDQRLSVTSRSVNIIREYRNYLWITDRDGRVLNEPEHEYSHSMDAIRYALTYDIGHKASSTTWVKRDRKNVAL